MMMGAMLFACTSEDELNKDGQINLRTSVQGVQKSARTPSLNEDGSGVFTDGDCMKLVISGGEKLYANSDYTIGTTQLYWRNVDMDEAVERVTFSACYPLQESTSGCFVFDLSKTDEPDLLLARTEQVEVGTELPVMMAFKHALCKLSVNYTVDDSFTSVDKETIQTKCLAVSGCEVNLLAGTLDHTDFPKAQFTAQGSKIVFLLIPQEVTEIGFEVQLGDVSCHTSLGELIGKNLSLESGKEVTLNLTLKEGRLELGGFTIEGWGDQGSFDQDVIM